MCGSYIFFVWLKCTYDVATDFGKYLRTILDVNPGHDWRNPLSKASTHMYGTGLNAEACRYGISYGSDNF